MMNDPEMRWFTWRILEEIEVSGTYIHAQAVRVEGFRVV